MDGQKWMRSAIAWKGTAAFAPTLREGQTLVFQRRYSSPRATPPLLRGCSNMSGPKAPLQDDEEELGLPPLDGALGEPSALAEEDGDIEAFDLNESSPLEDAIANVDPGFEIDFVEEHAPKEVDPVKPLDVGVLLEDDALPEDSHRPHDDRSPLYDIEESSPFDSISNAEAGHGTSDDPSDFVDEDALPPLASSEAEQQDDPQRTNTLLAKAHQSPLIFPWDRGAWRVCPAAGATVPCWLVAVSSPRDRGTASRVVAAGPTILIVRDDARIAKRGPDIDAVALAAKADVLFVVTRSGSLFASVDAGESWFSVQHEPVSTSPPVSIAITPGKLWVCDEGSLFHAPDAENSGFDNKTEVHREGVRAITETGSTLVVLRKRDAQWIVERSRGDDEPSTAEVVPPLVRETLNGQTPMIAAAEAGSLLALITPTHLHISRDAGRSFDTHRIGTTLAFTFAGDTRDAPWLALVEPFPPAEAATISLQNQERDSRAARPTAPLVLLQGSASGRIVAVAEVRTAPPFGRAALSWDASREVVWVATPAGLIALERAPHH